MYNVFIFEKVLRMFRRGNPVVDGWLKDQKCAKNSRKMTTKFPDRRCSVHDLRVRVWSSEFVMRDSNKYVEI